MVIEKLSAVPCCHFFFSDRSVVSFVAMICCVFLIACNKQKPAESAPSAAESSPQAIVEDAATRDLRKIGDKAMIALLARDVDTLIAFDSNPDDEASLKNKTGDPYCYLFDATCASNPNARSIYDKLAGARKLAIDASVSETPLNGKRYGLLLFYDKSKISDTQIYSQEFICSEKGLRETASWHFILEKEKWTTSTVFDYKVPSDCKP
jgi:hypothetical protein